MKLPPAGLAVAPLTDYIPIPALSPKTGSVDATLLVSRTLLLDLEAKGETRRYYDALLLPEVVENPTVVFEGLKRVNYQDQDGCCYVGVPSCRWLDEQTKEKIPPLKVFVVTVATAGADAHVLWWEWRFVDLKRPGYPKKWQSDFGRQVWPPTNC